MEGADTRDILRSVSESYGLPWPRDGRESAWVSRVLDRVPVENHDRVTVLLDLAQQFAKQRRLASVAMILARVRTLRC
jgi:hypothetical protein